MRPRPVEFTECLLADCELVILIESAISTLLIFSVTRPRLTCSIPLEPQTRKLDHSSTDKVNGKVACNSARD
jgi:hypothetical protein